MAASANLSAIIRHYAEKQNSAFIDYKEFCIYIKKYAERHVEEVAELVKYLGEPSQIVSAELQGLLEKHLVAITTVNNKKTIVAITYLSVKYANQYKEIKNSEQIPYPLLSDLPKNFPLTAIENKQADTYIPQALKEQNLKSPLLYILEFSKEIPSIILPACVPVSLLIESAQIKIRRLLKKEQYHDFIFKKLRSTNQQKELSIQTFFSNFIDSHSMLFFDFTQDDTYYLWNQTLYYIRQDIEKVQDKTTEDINILQAARISEIHSVCLKQKFQEQQKRKEALKELEKAFDKPPYFYSMPQILKFQDKSGRPLYGFYSENDLKKFLSALSSDGSENELPTLLVFKVESGTRYYVYKKNVIQVVLRLCNETHDTIESELENKWLKVLSNYEKLPEMTNQQAFERVLENMVEEKSPVLYALLNSNFINVLAMEKSIDTTLQSVQLFDEGHLMPYSKILMISNSRILSNAKSRLPIFYTIPVISWIIALFHSKKSKKKNDASAEEKEIHKHKSMEKQPQNKAEALALKATEITKELIPEGSDIDRELNYLLKQWNKMISKEAYNNLTEDVNSLIRDYTRQVVKTMSTVAFTRERVENLAKTLVRTPNMQKINEEKALTEYVTLYILRLVSNVKKIIS